MSQVEVDKIIPQSGTTLTIGDSGDTITIPSGVTLSNSGIITNFESTGIDDNATSTAITIDSGDRVRINNTTSTGHGSVYNLIVGNESSGGDAGVLVVTPNNENAYYGFGDDGGVPGYLNYNHISNFLRTYVNGSEAMRIDSSGKVGINTTSPNTTLHVGNGTDTSEYITLQSSDDKRLTFQGASVYRAEIGVYESNHNDLVLRAGSSAGIRFVTNNENFSGNGANPIRINTLGYLGIGTNSPSQRLDVDGSIEVSGGIYIGGTGSANYLDDYEEGTFTPQFSSTGASFTYTAAKGVYTKIGRQVCINIYLQLDGSQTLTANNVSITGLPFTSANISQLISSLACEIRLVNLSTGATSLFGRIDANVTSIGLFESGDNYATTSLRSNQLSGSSGQVILSGTYPAA